MEAHLLDENIVNRKEKCDQISELNFSTILEQIPGLSRKAILIGVVTCSNIAKLAQQLKEANPINSSLFSRIDFTNLLISLVGLTCNFVGKDDLRPSKINFRIFNPLEFLGL